ncbi:MAG TPA: DUF3034 family protein [Steroidobacteraceae bacterium]|nr:DUF3034 family protein [Steroidobacteraceae bacterium]
MRRCERLTSILLGTAMLVCGTPALAEGWFGDQGKLLLTAGFSTVEGAGGGGLTPWALITGYGSSESWGANTHVTGIALRDFDFSSAGVGIGIRDRVELSFSRQRLEGTDGALDGLSVSQDVIGAKLRIFGDAVYAQDSWAPQVAIGVLAKHNRGIRADARIGAPDLVSVEQLDASNEDDIDYYASATKIWLAQGLLVNATVRYTRANQFGLLGFGGDLEDEATIQGEATLAYLFRRKVAIGVEYRTRDRHLSVDDESAAWDALVAWTPNRHVSIVAAYANLSSIAAPLTGQSADQAGAYLSAQVGF